MITRAGQRLAQWWPRHERAISLALVVGVALVASGSGIGNGFVLDDALIVQNRTLIHSLRDPAAILVAPYWDEPSGGSLWRPLGLLSFGAQWALGQGDPAVFHLVNIALYLVVCLLVWALARRMMPAGAALLAALVFAAHPVHVESVANVVGQLELWVAASLLGAVLLYVRDRQAGVLRWRTVVRIAALQLTGLAFKEHALLLLPLLGVAELTVARAPMAASAEGERLSGWARLRILTVLLAGLCVTWMAIRGDILGVMTGDWPHRALRGLSMTERAWVMLGLVPEAARLMCWPARLYADYSPQLVQALPTPHLLHLAGAGWVLAWTAGVGLAWRLRDRALGFALLWGPVSVALVSNILIPTGVLLAERTLFLATLSVALLGGVLVARVWPVLTSAKPELRTAVVVVGAAVVALAAAHSNERQRVWKDNVTMLAAITVDAPANPVGFYWLGDTLLRAGQVAEGLAVLERARVMWDRHEGPSFVLGLAYERARRCERAVPLYREVMALDPDRPIPFVGVALCLQRARRYHESREVALDGFSKVLHSHAALRYLVIRADSLLAASDSVSSNNWWLAAQKRQNAGGG